RSRISEVTDHVSDVGITRKWGSPFASACVGGIPGMASFCRDCGRKMRTMRLGGTGRGGQLVFAQFSGAAWVAARPAPGHAQFFPGTPVRPPNDVPSVPPGPAQPITPTNPAPAAPKGPMLQSLPPNPGASAQAQPSVPAGQGALAVSARFGRDLPAISGGLHWRIYRAEQTGLPRIVQEDRSAAPTFLLPPASY